ncbi:MAG: hypothetical protein KIT15_16940 [Xanthobacteraceae bacterium]|nr:hypothetical protein [Xanthobacteraceae bacterium]
MAAWRRNMKAVCVDNSTNEYFGPCKLRLDAVYTVAHVTLDGGLFLKEIETAAPLGFRQDRFKPAVVGKTDAGMAILKTILDEVNAGKHREIVDA